jgi:hypothetical protein
MFEKLDDSRTSDTIAGLLVYLGFGKGASLSVA